MYAIVETGGKQFRVSEGDIIRTDLIETEVGSSITFDRIILAADGDDVSIGTPVLSGVTVSGTVLRQAKDKKILVFRYKSKKRIRKLNGHRQRFAEVRIDKISLA
jgi:large subunit ribosomal protein L21